MNGNQWKAMGIDENQLKSNGNQLKSNENQQTSDESQ